MKSDRFLNLKNIAKESFYAINSNPLSKFIYSQDMFKRALLPLTDIEKLTKPINMFSPYTKEIHKPNDWYGHANNLKLYLGLPTNYQFKFIMEHGLYLNEDVDQIDIGSDLPSIVTYSDFRVNALKLYRQNSFSIGPFIHYATSHLTNTEIKLEKKRLGKNILLFPVHSTPDIDIEYDIVRLCQKVKKIGKNFQTIRVCLYWKDVLLGKAEIYRKYGFECVSAGHMLDPLFLSRLKSLILISDLTLSNVISAPTGYSIFLNRPHILLSESLKMKTSKYWKERIGDYWNSNGYNLVQKEFSKNNFKITPKQKKMLAIYWGSNRIKSKKGLMKIIKLTEKIYLNQK